MLPPLNLLSQYYKEKLDATRDWFKIHNNLQQFKSRINRLLLRIMISGAGDYGSVIATLIEC